MSDENKTDKTPTAKASEEDKELADLLNSALEDFSKFPQKPATTTKESQDGSSAASKPDEPVETIPETQWSEEFIKQASEQFESNIASLLRDSGGSDLSPEQLQQSFQKMAEAAAQVAANPTDLNDAGDTDFAQSISQALRGLSEGAEGLQSPFSDQDILNMFGQGGGGDEGNIMQSFMQGMMQSLLSKEVLYPSLKDIVTKYPSWLEANGGSLTAEDRKKYDQQYKLMQEVCEQLEKENENDTPEQKKEQFEKVLNLMQKLQDCGQPPSDLVGDLKTGLPFDAQGNPDMNQCSLM